MKSPYSEDLIRYQKYGSYSSVSLIVFALIDIALLFLPTAENLFFIGFFFVLASTFTNILISDQVSSLKQAERDWVVRNVMQNLHNLHVESILQTIADLAPDRIIFESNLGDAPISSDHELTNFDSEPE